MAAAPAKGHQQQGPVGIVLHPCARPTQWVLPNIERRHLQLGCVWIAVMAAYQCSSAAAQGRTTAAELEIWVLVPPLAA